MKKIKLNKKWNDKNNFLLFVSLFFVAVLILFTFNVSAVSSTNYQRAVKWTFVVNKYLGPVDIYCNNGNTGESCQGKTYEVFIYKPSGIDVGPLKVSWLFDEGTTLSEIASINLGKDAYCGKYKVTTAWRNNGPGTPLLPMNQIVGIDVVKNCTAPNEAKGQYFDAKATSSYESSYPLQYIDSMRGEMDFNTFWNLLPSSFKNNTKGICVGGSKTGNSCIQDLDCYSNPSTGLNYPVCQKLNWTTAFATKDKCVDGGDNEGPSSISGLIPYGFYVGNQKFAAQDLDGNTINIPFEQDALNSHFRDMDDPNCKFQNPDLLDQPEDYYSASPTTPYYPTYKTSDYKSIPYSKNPSGNALPYCIDKDHDGFCGCIENPNGDINNIFKSFTTSAGTNTFTNLPPYGDGGMFSFNKYDKINLCLTNVDGNPSTWSASLSFTFTPYDLRLGSAVTPPTITAVMPAYNGINGTACSKNFEFTVPVHGYITYTITTSGNTPDGEMVFIGTGSGGNDGSNCNWAATASYYNNVTGITNYVKSTLFPDCSDDPSYDTSIYVNDSGSKILTRPIYGWLGAYANKPLSSWNIHSFAPVAYGTCSIGRFDFNCNKDFAAGYDIFNLKNSEVNSSTSPFDLDLRTGIENLGADSTSDAFLYSQNKDLECYVGPDPKVIATEEISKVALVVGTQAGAILVLNAVGLEPVVTMYFYGQASYDVLRQIGDFSENIVTQGGYTAAWGSVDKNLLLQDLLMFGAGSLQYVKATQIGSPWLHTEITPSTIKQAYQSVGDQFLQLTDSRFGRTLSDERGEVFPKTGKSSKPESKANAIKAESILSGNDEIGAVITSKKLPPKLVQKGRPILNSEELSNILDSGSFTPAQTKIVLTLFKNLDYVSFEQFLWRLDTVRNQLVPILGDGEKTIVLHSEYYGKSNRWVWELLKAGMTKKTLANVEDMYFPHSTAPAIAEGAIKDAIARGFRRFIYVDDAIYSGNQAGSAVASLDMIITNLGVSSPVDLYIAAPYYTDFGESNTLRDIGKETHINMRGFVTAQKMKVLKDYLTRGQLDTLGLDDFEEKSLTLTYFAFKIPDFASFYPSNMVQQGNPLASLVVDDSAQLFNWCNENTIYKSGEYFAEDKIAYRKFVDKYRDYKPVEKSLYTFKLSIPTSPGCSAIEPTDGLPAQ